MGTVCQKTLKEPTMLKDGSTHPSSKASFMVGKRQVTTCGAVSGFAFKSGKRQRTRPKFNRRQIRALRGTNPRIKNDQAQLLTSHSSAEDVRAVLSAIKTNRSCRSCNRMVTVITTPKAPEKWSTYQRAQFWTPHTKLKTKASVMRQQSREWAKTKPKAASRRILNIETP